jgi:hypothetical protein
VRNRQVTRSRFSALKLRRDQAVRRRMDLMCLVNCLVEPASLRGPSRLRRPLEIRQVLPDSLDPGIFRFWPARKPSIDRDVSKPPSPVGFSEGTFFHAPENDVSFLSLLVNSLLVGNSATSGAAHTEIPRSRLSGLVSSNFSSSRQDLPLRPRSVHGAWLGTRARGWPAPARRLQHSGELCPART